MNPAQLFPLITETMRSETAQRVDAKVRQGIKRVRAHADIRRERDGDHGLRQRRIADGKVLQARQRPIPRIRNREAGICPDCRPSRHAISVGTLEKKFRKWRRRRQQCSGPHLRP